MSGRRVTLALAFFSAALLSAASAAADGLPSTNTGGETELGIHMGGFMLYPKLDISGQYNDNVFAVNTGAKSDVSLDVLPSLRLESTWTHFLVALTAQYDLRRYDKFTQEDTDDYVVKLETQIDVDSATQFAASTEYGRFSELPGNTNISSNAAEPTEYDRWDNHAGIKHIFNRLQGEIGGAFTTLRFQNTPAVGGGTIFSVDRNRDVASIYADAGFQFSPGYQVFARASWNQRDYQLAVFKFRDSTGFDAVGGVRVQLTHLIDGQVYFGYLQQNYHAPLTDIGGFDAGAQLHWAATRLTDVNLNVSRSVEETDEAGATGYLATIVSLDVSHQLTRSVTLNAGISYNNNDYHGVTQNEDIFGATLGVDYHFMPQLHLVADYRYTSRDSNLLSANYDQNIFEAHVGLAL